MTARQARRTVLPRPTAAGVAALTVVMILFFIMALVAAYTNRNLVFEQRISANSYRAARAAESADAGLDWTLAMLNGGRIDALCRPSNDPALSDFRRRYVIDSTLGGQPGSYQLPWTFDNTLLMYPACINKNGALNCICPSLDNRNPTMVTPADGNGGAFRIQFDLPGNNFRPGTMGVIARGCASPGAGSTSCYTQSSSLLIDADALANTQINVGLVRSLPLAPLAALTVGGAVTINSATLGVSNGSSSAGMTVHAPALPALVGTGVGVYAGPAGSGSDGVVVDPGLGQLAGQANDLWFRSLFGMNRTTLSTLPATRTLTCAAGNCTATDLTPTTIAYPRTTIWVPGNLDLDAAGTLGSATDPVLIIVTGNLTISANVTVVGMIHASNISVTAPATVQGALVTSGNFSTTANTTLAYNQVVMDTLALRYGSFARVPGSWKQLAG